MTCMFILCSTCFFLEMIRSALSDVQKVTREIVGSLRGWIVQQPSLFNMVNMLVDKEIISCLLFPMCVYIYIYNMCTMNVSVCHLYFRCVNCEDLPILSQRTSTQWPKKIPKVYLVSLKCIGWMASLFVMWWLASCSWDVLGMTDLPTAVARGVPTWNRSLQNLIDLFRIW